MIPYTPPPNPQRDKLAQQASWLPEWLLRGGSKSPDDIRAMARDMKDKGASPTDIYNETGRHVDPDTETGLAYGPGGDWQFQIPDKDMRLTPGAMSWLEFKGIQGGDTPPMNLSEAMQHDLLYERVPNMKDVKTELTQIEPDDKSTIPGGEYQEPNGLTYDAWGRIKARGAANVDINDPTKERSLRSILAHEIQHPLQYMYDMPRGGSPNTPGLDKYYQSKMVPQAATMRKALLDQYKQFSKLDPENPNNMDLWRKQFPEKAALLDESSRVGGFNNPQSVAQHNKLMPFDQYLSLAGEQRAMQAARDSTKTAAELRDNPPMATMLQPFNSKDWTGKSSMPEPLQIVRRQGSKQFSGYSLPDLPYFQRNY